MSILEILKLPAGFGYLLLVLGLILSLAPWFHGLDFGVLKVPDFSSRARRVLKWVGPLALALAIGLHVPVPARDVPSGVTFADRTGALSRDETNRQVSEVQTDVSAGQHILAIWQDSGCLYPVRLIGRSASSATVRFAFGEEAERAFGEIFATTDPKREIGADVWAEVPRGDAWALGTVRDTRTNHLLIELRSEASCVAGFEKLQTWLPIADVIGIQELENF